MEEFEIIHKIQKLRNIEPRKEWTEEMRNRFLEPKRKVWGFLPSFQFNLRPAAALASLVALLIVGVGLGLVFRFQNPIVSLSSRSQDPSHYLTLAEKNIDNIKMAAAQDNKGKILSMTRNAQKIIEKAANLLPLKPKDPKQAKEIVEKVAKITQKSQAINKSLGIDINTKSLASKTEKMVKNGIKDARAKLVEAEIKSLEGRSLTREQEKLFLQAKNDYNKGNFEQALEKILELTNNSKRNH